VIQNRIESKSGEKDQITEFPVLFVEAETFVKEIPPAATPLAPLQVIARCVAVLFSLARARGSGFSFNRKGIIRFREVVENRKKDGKPEPIPK